MAGGVGNVSSTSDNNNSSSVSASTLLSQQIHAMNNYALCLDGCRRKYLLKYFNENIDGNRGISKTQLHNGQGVNENNVNSEISNNSNNNSNNYYRNYLMDYTCCDLCDEKNNNKKLSSSSNKLNNEIDVNRESMSPISLGKEMYLLLSAVSDCGEQYGVTVPIAILVGCNDKSTQRIYNYNNLATFNQGKNHSKEWWKGLVYQLIDIEFMLESILTKSSSFSFERLALTKKGRNFLNLTSISKVCQIGSKNRYKDDTEDLIHYIVKPNRDFVKAINFELKKNIHNLNLTTRRILSNNQYDDESDIKIAITSSLSSSSLSLSGTTPYSDRNIEFTPYLCSKLEEILIDKRKELSIKHNIHPYNILSKTDLISLSQHRPCDVKELNNIEGWGNVKINTFGYDFIKEIINFSILHKLEIFNSNNSNNNSNKISLYRPQYSNNKCNGVVNLEDNYIDQQIVKSNFDSKAVNNTIECNNNNNNNKRIFELYEATRNFPINEKKKKLINNNSSNNVNNDEETNNENIAEIVIIPSFSANNISANKIKIEEESSTKSNSNEVFICHNSDTKDDSPDDSLMINTNITSTTTNNNTCSTAITSAIIKEELNNIKNKTNAAAKAARKRRMLY
jgi:superfamily II DNA helicase RecQ